MADTALPFAAKASVERGAETLVLGWYLLPAMPGSLALPFAVRPKATVWPTSRMISADNTAFSLLGSAERLGDQQGERLLRDGLALARRHGETYPLLATLNNLARADRQVYSLRDGAGAAEARVHSMTACRSPARCRCNLPLRSTIPIFDVFALGNLGELLVRKGELDEAGSLLQQALAKANDGGYRAIAPRVECSIGEWLLARGEFASRGQPDCCMACLLQSHCRSRPSCALTMRSTSHPR